MGGAATGVYVVSPTRTDWQAWDLFDDWPGVGDWLHENTPDPRPFAVDPWPEPSVRLHAGGDPDKRYWQIGPDAAKKAPEGGWGLVLFLAGGDGGEEYHSFCKKIWSEALSDRYVAAQLVAKEWSPPHFSQRVWPTKRRPVSGMKFSTEEFVQSVIQDVATRLPIDSRRIFVLGWSSGGPGAYAVALHEPRIVSGALVAMSTFQPEALDLQAAKGAALYLHHSKDDTVTPFRLAERAVEKLTEAGAKVTLSTYEGGHGWHGNVYTDLWAGFDWLEKNATR